MFHLVKNNSVDKISKPFFWLVFQVENSPLVSIHISSVGQSWLSGWGKDYLREAKIIHHIRCTRSSIFTSPHACSLFYRGYSVFILHWEVYRIDQLVINLNTRTTIKNFLHFTNPVKNYYEIEQNKWNFFHFVYLRTTWGAKRKLNSLFLQSGFLNPNNIPVTEINSTEKVSVESSSTENF